MDDVLVVIASFVILIILFILGLAIIRGVLYYIASALHIFFTTLIKGPEKGKQLMDEYDEYLSGGITGKKNKNTDNDDYFTRYTNRT